jgi:hypothetical protein
MATNDRKPTIKTPLKVSEDTRELIRWGSGLFECTQGEFVARSVADYLTNSEALIDELVAAKQAKASRMASASPTPTKPTKP